MEGFQHWEKKTIEAALWQFMPYSQTGESSPTPHGEKR